MTNWAVILDITRTHLWSRIKQSSVAALGVTFGIGTFIILVSFMTGLNGLLDGLILNRTPHIRIYNELKPNEYQPIEQNEEFKNTFNVVHNIKPKAGQSRIHNVLPLKAELENDKRVKGVTAQVTARVFYLAGSIELAGVATGIQISDELSLFNFGEYVVQGSPEDLLKSNNGILLGAGIAKKMSLKVGDRVQVGTISGGVFPLKIVGIYQSGLADIDNSQSYVNLKTAQQLLGEGSNYITDLNVKLYDLEESVTMAPDISQKYSVTATDIKTANAQFETGTSIRNIITYAVSITLLLVAGFGIYNILNMLIYEKMNDIAILKATGFSGKDVKKIFISQAMMIGLIGGTLGLIIGYSVSVLISHTPFHTEAIPTIKTFPVNFDPKFYVIGVVFALISTFLAGYLPARRAEKIDPVDIIRGQ
jgi:lipoprotein-releasing system permease protein